MEDKVNKNSDNNKDENLETSSKHTEITNDDGSITYLSQTTEKKTGTGIISDPQKVEEISLGVSAEDTKYVDAIRSKKESENIYKLPLDEDFSEITDDDNKKGFSILIPHISLLISISFSLS